MATATHPMNAHKSWLGRRVAHAVGFTRGMPTPFKVVLGLMLAVAVGLAGFYLVARRDRHNANAAEGVAWKKFEEAARADDWPAMDAALVEVLAAKPGDATATLRRRAIAEGDASPNDPQMPRLTLRKAMKAEDAVAIKREAEKLLVHAPNDWLPRLALAQILLNAGDADAAAAEVDQLPNPEASGTALYPGVVTFGFQIYRRLGRDSAPLRHYVQSHFTRLLKSVPVRNMPPGERLSLVECYLLGFEPGEAAQPTNILESFAAARDLVAAAANDASADPAATDVVARAARLGPPLELAAVRFEAAGQITPRQRDEFVADDRERGERLWGEVLKRDPKSGEAYRNLATLAARRKDGAGALEFLKTGLKESPDDVGLAGMQDQLMRNMGQGVESARRLAAEARRRPQSPDWWSLAVQSARLAGRADLAIELLTESRRLRPGETWTVYGEAELRLAAGDAKAAAAAILPLGAEVLAQNDASLRLAARAFSEGGRRAELASLAEAAEARGRKGGVAGPAGALIAGLLDAAPDEARLADAAARAEVALRRNPGEPGSLKLLARAQFLRAKLADWGRDEVARAVGAATRYRAAAFGDRDVALWLGELRLYGEDRAEQALRDLEPVRRDEAEVGARELGVVGEALRRAGERDQALRVLSLAADQPRPGAGVFIQLALARQAGGDAARAKEALAKAQQLPRTPREQADYAAAARLLY